MPPSTQKTGPRKPQYTVPEVRQQQNDIPPESTNVVILKTVMELKESFGGVRQDLDHLKAEVDGIKKDQKASGRIIKVLAGIGFISTLIWSAVLYIVANWENIKTIVKSAASQI